MSGRADIGRAPARGRESGRAYGLGLAIRILRRRKVKEDETLHRRFLAEFGPEERADYLAGLGADAEP